MSIIFILNDNQVQCKPTENFEQLFDEYIKNGRFIDKIWMLNGQQLSGITKYTKISVHIKENCNLYCLDKGNLQTSQLQNSQQSSPFQQNSQPPSPFQQNSQQPSPFQPIPIPSSPFQASPQPPSPFNQMNDQKQGSQQQRQTQLQNGKQPVFPIGNQIQQNPVVVPNLIQNSNTIKQDGLGFLNQSRQMIINKPSIKRQQIDDRTGKEYTDLKVIKGYTIQIKDYGKTVTLEKEDGSFKATFLEDNASEQEQDNIILLPNDVVQQPECQIKLAMGQDQSKSTKVLFLQGFRGIAIKWVTGLQTKFQFWLDE